MVLLFFIPIVSAHLGQYEDSVYAEINASPFEDVPVFHAEESMYVKSPISMTVPYTRPMPSVDLRIGVDGVILFGLLLFFVLIASVMNTVFRGYLYRN